MKQTHHVVTPNPASQAAFQAQNEAYSLACRTAAGTKEVALTDEEYLELGTRLGTLRKRGREQCSCSDVLTAMEGIEALGAVVTGFAEFMKVAEPAELRWLAQAFRDRLENEATRIDDHCC